MTSQTAIQSFLIFHLTGFVLFAGTTIADFVTARQFWKQHAAGSTAATAIPGATAGFPVLQRVGIGLLILSGIGMMALTGGLFGEQLWFRVKFAIVLLLILNALLVGRKQALLLRKMIKEEDTSPEKTGRIKNNLRLFHITQMVFLFLILLLSVFKFN